jgi:transcriptional regulator with XRE-family HTH domain
MRLSAQFGARLAAVRVNRGLTLAELAALVGRAKPTIGRCEHGGPAEIHRSDVAKCAHILRCSRKVFLAPLDEPISAPLDEGHFFELAFSAAEAAPAFPARTAAAGFQAPSRDRGFGHAELLGLTLKFGPQLLRQPDRQRAIHE